MMRVLVLSSVFPSQSRPTYGVFVRERLRHVAAHCAPVVVAPVPWFPLNRWIRGKDYASVPFAERHDGIPVYHPRYLCIPMVGKCLDGFLYFLTVLPFILWLRRRFAFDLIDAHFVYPDGVAGVLLGKAVGCPVLITLRGTHDLRHGSYRLRRPQIKYALQASTRIITLSESLRRFAVGLNVDPGKVRVIPNGVDSSRFVPGNRRPARQQLGLPEKAAILLAVGSLVESKGHHLVLEALPDLIAQRPDLLYVAIGGENPHDGYRRRLETLMQQRGLAGHVRIISSRPHEEIPAWIAAANVFCLATRSEGCCNAILEALACGLPVVTTRIPGNTELVRHGTDGFLVPFWDGPAFQAAVLEALDRDWDRLAIGTSARTNEWERRAEAVLEEFRMALHPGGPPPETAKERLPLPGEGPSPPPERGREPWGVTEVTGHQISDPFPLAPRAETLEGMR